MRTSELAYRIENSMAIDQIRPSRKTESDSGLEPLGTGLLSGVSFTELYDGLLHPSDWKIMGSDPSVRWNLSAAYSLEYYGSSGKS